MYLNQKQYLNRHIKLSPGHSLTLHRSQKLPHPNQYWDVPFSVDNSVSEQEAQEELIVRLQEAVKIHLMQKFH